MTAQVSESLTSEHPQLIARPQGHSCTVRGVPGTWGLYGVIRGTPTGSNHGWGDYGPDGKWVKVYSADPGNPQWMTTANWKGYVEQYRIERDGQLVFLGFTFDLEPPRPLYELITGDGYLVLKQGFGGPRLYLPFRAGKLVPERAEWLFEVSRGPARSEYRKGFHPDLLETST